LALPDAAAATGNYSSPSKASAFFGKIADEVSAACAAGRFAMRAANSPRDAAMELASGFRYRPETVRQSVYPSLSGHPLVRGTCIAREPRFCSAPTAFLNYRRHRPADDEPSMLRVSGWFFTSPAPSGSHSDTKIGRHAIRCRRTPKPQPGYRGAFRGMAWRPIKDSQSARIAVDDCLMRTADLGWLQDRQAFVGCSIAR